MANSFKIKIAVAEDGKFTREALIGKLQEEKDLSVLFGCSNGKILLENIKASAPDIVIMDVRMEIMDGIEATREIKKINADIKVVAWSVSCDLHTMLKMFEAGACAFLDKDTDYKEILKCLKSVYTQGFYDNVYFNRKIYDSINNGNKYLEFKVGDVVLTEEEIVLTKFLCKGWNNKIIKDEMHVEIRTVQRDVKALLEKTNTHCIALLVIFALKNGIIQLKEFQD